MLDLGIAISKAEKDETSCILGRNTQLCI